MVIENIISILSNSKAIAQLKVQDEEKIIQLIKGKENFVKEMQELNQEEINNEELIRSCSDCDISLQHLHKLCQYKKQLHESLVEKIQYQKEVLEKKEENIQIKIKGKKKKSANSEKSQNNLKLIQEIKQSAYQCFEMLQTNFAIVILQEQQIRDLFEQLDKVHVKKIISTDDVSSIQNLISQIKKKLSQIVFKEQTVSSIQYLTFSELHQRKVNKIQTLWKGNFDYQISLCFKQRKEITEPKQQLSFNEQFEKSYKQKITLEEFSNLTIPNFKANLYICNYWEISNNCLETVDVTVLFSFFYN